MTNEGKTAIEEPTVESIEGDIKRLNADLAEAQKGQESAIATMAKRQKDASVEELLELAEGVRDAKTTIAKVEGQIKIKNDARARLVWESQMGEVRENVQEPIIDAIKGVIKDNLPLLAERKVDGFSITAATIHGEASYAIRPTGESIPKAPGRTRSATGRTGGPRGRKTFTTPSGAMSSAELVDAFGVEVLGQERFDKVKADPHGQGLSHIADRIAKAKGFESVVTETAA